MEQRERVLKEILARLSADEDQRALLGTNSSVRSASRVFIPPISYTNIEFMDIQDDNGLSPRKPALSDSMKQRKSNMAVQTSNLYVPEVELYRQGFIGKDRPWGDMAQSLPLTHKDARTFLRKGNFM